MLSVVALFRTDTQHRPQRGIRTVGGYQQLAAEFLMPAVGQLEGRLDAGHALFEVEKRDPSMPPVLVPCKYERGTDEQLAETIIIENEHRKDDNVIQKAEKASRLLNMGYGVKDIGPMFGVSTQTINNWLSYLDLPKSERDAIIAGEQSAYAAKRKQCEKSGVRVVTMKKKKQIREKISVALECGTDYDDGFADALKWVLGEDK